MNEPKPCEQCGDMFDPPAAYLMGATQWRSRRFCSRQCAGASKRLKPASKVCETCGETFYRNSSYGWYKWEGQRFCSVPCAAKYRTGENHPLWKGGYRSLMFKYGISGEQYQAMLDGQGGVCAICEDRPATCVDHDHESGQVRSLLCSQCNSALGMFRDDPELADRAAEYLRSWLRVDIG